MNRLNLDFSLNTSAERRNYVEQYLEKINFTPTDEELEMMGNYILWGKSEEGKSVVDTKEVEIETRYKTWSRKENESLDALLEQPTFNENAVFVDVPTKIPRNVFSRTAALRDAPDHLRPIFEELFRQIDELDLILNYYDLAHGKRKNPPRDELLSKFDFNERAALEEKAAHLNQYKYLKMRHSLVELRNQQYTLRDSYAPVIQRALPQPRIEPEPIEFEYNVAIYPLGIKMPGTFMEMIFQPEDQLVPENFSEAQLKIISDFYWKKKADREKALGAFIDLTNPEHLAQLFLFFEDLEEQEFNQSTFAMLDTIRYYVDFANLDVVHQDILRMKIEKKTNQQIQQYINEKYGKSYTVNYISTIFRQKIIPAVIDGVEYHKEIISRIWFEEDFKRCIKCGRTLLISPHNFIRKARSHDGFNNKCKFCEKKERQERKIRND